MAADRANPSNANRAFSARAVRSSTFPAGHCGFMWTPVPVITFVASINPKPARLAAWSFSF